ncbi:MAG: beta-N-acetylhexosaminidase, partial [Bacteroidota bacterium]|nr:beta-N-acetylhexosaminidase [Bacteroidota bacterium]
MNKLYYFALCLCAIMTMSFHGQCQKIALIPVPAKMQLTEGEFQINKSTRIYCSTNDSKHSAGVLSALLFGKAEKGKVISGVPGNAGKNYIFFKEVKDLPTEGYRLSIKSQNVVLEATGSVGFFYAVQTIRQLLPLRVKASEKATLPSLPNLTIEDYPRFAWRGLMLDVSRHFQTLEEIKTFIDYMALYKLNTLHLHLTDDQGWRVEIKKYPLLTEKGAWREHNTQDNDCLNRAKEDPTYTIPEKNYKMIAGKKMYGGYYTQDQLRDLVRYASERCITIIPEVDMPGHFKAAVDLYPELSCTKEAGWGSLFSFPACPSKETTYEFMKNVLTEIASIFPAPYIHIGGDEVNVDSWKKCPLCQSSIQKKGLKDEHELQSDFNRQIEAFLHSKGKKLLGWDEITEGGLTKEATVMWWRNWAPKAPYQAVKNGNDLIMSPDFQYYLSAENLETPLQKVYDYEPCPADFTTEDAKHLLGVQACFWSEQIPNFTRLQFQAFPRIMALAETAWT